MKAEATEQFYQFMRHRSRSARAYGPTCANANSYYIDHLGSLSPDDVLHATRASKRFSFADFEFEHHPASSDSPQPQPATADHRVL